MEYTVKEVISFSEQTYGKYGNHRIAFKVEGNDKQLSAFRKNNITVGEVLNGEIKVTEKDGKTYNNFEFAKKESGGGQVDNLLLKDIFDNTETILNRLVGLGLDIEIIRAHVVPKKAKAEVIDEYNYPESEGEMPF